uniref:Uncharacterized protein n=1 Tax=Nelumbo nucifera TaxID=4432 RepID=A0A822XVR2_NELNU|nr:TPA_asm: hypothetical protein HUJ06_027191 [Nelumbo nucifera]
MMRTSTLPGLKPNSLLRYSHPLYQHSPGRKQTPNFALQPFQLPPTSSF